MYIKHTKPDGQVWYMEYVPDDPIERFHYFGIQVKGQLALDCYTFWGNPPHPLSIYNAMKELRDNEFPEVPDSELDKYKPNEQYNKTTP